jgi:hypothetical protein
MSPQNCKTKECRLLEWVKCLETAEFERVLTAREFEAWSPEINFCVHARPQQRPMGYFGLKAVPFLLPE